MQISVGIYFLLEAPASWWAEALLCSGMTQAGLLGGRRWLGRGGRWPWWSAGPRCQQLGKWTLQRRSWAWRPGSLLWWLLRASLPRARSGRSRSCCVGKGGGPLGRERSFPQHAVLWAVPPMPSGLQASCAGSGPCGHPA